MYCGEKTFPKATTATIDAAAYVTKRSTVAGPRAKKLQAAARATTPATVVTIAAACAPFPVRFCEP